MKKLTLLLLFTFSMISCGDSSDVDTQTTAPETASTQNESEPVETQDGEPVPLDIPPSDTPRVKIETSLGDIVLELDRKNAPVTVENFLSYVNDGFYDNTVFHRVIDGFMIQGGGFELSDGKLSKKQTKAPIQNESKNGLKNDRGTIAMARTPDPHSATAQFFINHGNNHALNYPISRMPAGHDWGYAVFGKTVEGLDILDKIATTPAKDRSPHPGAPVMEGLPIEPVVIKSIAIVE